MDRSRAHRMRVQHVSIGIDMHRIGRKQPKLNKVGHYYYYCHDYITIMIITMFQVLILILTPMV